MVKSFKWLSISLLFLLSCGNPINLYDIRGTGALTVSTVTIVDNKIIVNGNGFQEIRGLALSDGAGFYKPFTLSSYTNRDIIGTNSDNQPIPVGEPGYNIPPGTPGPTSYLMNLIIDTAEGATSIPVTFTLQPNSVYTGAIQDEAVTLDKISQAGAQPGDVIIYDGSQWVLGPAASASGTGTGGVDRITFGEGIVGAPGSTTATTVTIAIDVGTTGTPTATLIPYFNIDNELEIDTSAKIVFSQATNNYAVSNDGDFTISIEDSTVSPTTFNPLLTINQDGDVNISSPPSVSSPTLRVGGELVCLEDGSGCPPDLSGTITNIIGIPPILATPPTARGTTVTISADTGMSSGQLVLLENAGPSTPTGAVGFLPAVDGSKLQNIVTKIISSTAIIVNPPSGTGVVTLDLATGGSGTAQPWSPALEDISNISPYPPADGQFIVGSGGVFAGSAYSLPTVVCPNGEIMSSDGSNFICDTSVSSFNSRIGAIIPAAGDYNAGQVTNTPAGAITSPNVQAALNELDLEKLALAGGTMTGTIVSTVQNALQLDPFSTGAGNTGEVRFKELAVNGINYVGFKAPDSVPGSNTIWTLPPTDGASGTILTTNGNKILSWNSASGLGLGDVVGPSSSSNTNLASFNGTTGKIIQDTGISSNNVVQMSSLGTGPFVLSSILGNKNIIESTILISTLPTMAVDATSANNVILSAGPNKNLKATAYTVPPNVCPNGQSLVSDGTNLVCNFTTGNVTGPTSSTDNAIARFDLTTGKIIQNSGVIVSDANGITGISTLATSGNVTIGGTLGITGQTTFNLGANSSIFPPDRGSPNQVLITNGVGTLSWANNPQGDVIGQTTSITDNITVYADATGKLIKDSLLPVANVIRKATNFTNANRVVLSAGPNHTVLEAAYTFPPTDGIANQILRTNGAGAVSWVSVPSNVGDVTGPASSTPGAPAVYADATGKFLAGTIPYTIPIINGTAGQVLTTNGSGVASWAATGDVTGPAASFSGNLASFNGFTGKIIQDSGIASANVVTNTGVGTDNAVARFDTATGKLIQNSLVTIDDSGNMAGVGSITSIGNLSVTGNGTFSGALMAQSYTNTSDRALKKDIVPFTGASFIVDKLMPVMFRWKNGDEKVVIGLIAQDVEKVIPEVISTSNHKGKELRSYDVGQVLVLTLEALKETREELKQTKKEIKNLRKKIQELEDRNL